MELRISTDEPLATLRLAARILLEIAGNGDPASTAQPLQVFAAPAPLAIPMPPSSPVQVGIEPHPMPFTVDAPASALVSEVDTAGIPWDGRIHASTKNKTQQGVWKRKRGVDPALVETVTAKLAQPAPAPVAQPTPAVISFGPLIAKIAEFRANGWVTDEQIVVWCQTIGINSPTELTTVSVELLTSFDKKLEMVRPPT